MDRLSVSVASIGKFHGFDLARELDRQKALDRFFTGYPKRLASQSGVACERTYVQSRYMVPYMVARRRFRFRPTELDRLEQVVTAKFDTFVRDNLGSSDVFVALSGTSTSAAVRAQALGSAHICDRGSAHVLEQDKLLREEHARWGLPYKGISEWMIQRELAEYESADQITVPSRFAAETFFARGFGRSRVATLPYGVDLTKFPFRRQRTRKSFDVLFVGNLCLQKGAIYLLAAFKKLSVPRKSLVLVGTVDDSVVELAKRLKIWPEEVERKGHLSHAGVADAMRSAHVLVLPSVQDGFGLVLAQAMASGCAVIASENTGGPDLFTDGESGIIVPVRSVEAIHEALARLSADADGLEMLRTHGAERVRSQGGWSGYGAEALSLYSHARAAR